MLGKRGLDLDFKLEDVNLYTMTKAVNANVSIDVEETVDKVNSFKYLGAIKTSTGSCSEDVKAIIGRAKKANMELER